MSSSLSRLSDESLLSRTRDLVAKEREVTTEVLKLLREVERRKLFCSLGYGSLFDYCVKHLGYSEGGAQRRITSMRLLKELPQLEQKVRDGALSLSVLSQAHTFFRQEEKATARMAPDAKLEVIQALEGKSSREAERELVLRSSQPAELLPTRIRPVTPTHSRLEVVLPEEVLEDLTTLKGLLAHRHPNLSHAELIGLLARMALEKLDPRRETRQEKAARLKEQTPGPQASKGERVISAKDSPPTPAVTEPAPLDSSLPPTRVTAPPTPAVAARPRSDRSPSAALRRAVYRRDGVRCSYRDPRSGRICGSRHALQLDHRLAYAKGGHTEFDNLRVLCRQHNLRSAFVTFGKRKARKIPEPVQARANL